VLTSAALVAFVPSTDLDRAERFYVGVLGLARVEVSPYALVVQSGPTQVRVTKVDHLDPQPFTVLGWTVGDISSNLADLVEQGVTAERFDGMGQDEEGIWTAPGGAQVAWFKDPDGNLLSVTQLPA
jgi:catechol 2,3-dioxygenase-like lactoylglutathione lyase family enzyme